MGPPTPRLAVRVRDGAGAPRPSSSAGLPSVQPAERGSSKVAEEIAPTHFQATLEDALASLSTARWASPEKCTEAEPDAGLAPVATLELFRCVSRALRHTRSSLATICPTPTAGLVLNTVRRLFGSELALAGRICDVLETEVVRITFVQNGISGVQLAKDDGIDAGVELLSALCELLPPSSQCSTSSSAESGSTGIALELHVLFRLFECLLWGNKSAFQENWPDVQQKLEPVFDLVRCPRLLRYSPSALVLLLRLRLPHVADEVARLWREKKENSGRSSVECLYSLGCLVRELLEIAASPGEGGPAEEDIKAVVRMQAHVTELCTQACHATASLAMVEPMASRKALSGGEATAEAAEPLQQARGSSIFAEQAVATSRARALATGHAPSERDLDQPQDMLAREHDVCQTSRASQEEAVLSVAAELAGGKETMVRKLAMTAKDEVASLTKKRLIDESGPQTAPLGNHDRAYQRLQAIVGWLGAMLKIVDVKAVASEIAQNLVGCILQSVELPDALRTTIRPLADMALGPDLVHAVASELWAQVKASSSKGSPVSLLWVKEAGRFATEIEEALKRLSLDPGAVDADQISRTREVVLCLQWVAHFHLSWMGHRQYSLEDVEVSEGSSGPSDRGIAPAASPLGASSRASRRSLKLQLSNESLASAGGSGSAPEDDGEASEVVPTSPTSEASLSDNDRASDLDDFVDLAPESNAYGLLAQLTGKPGQTEDRFDQPGCNENADEGAKAPVVREYFSNRRIVPDWQAQCRMLIQKHGSPPECPTTKILSSPLPKKRRLGHKTPGFMPVT